MIHLTKASHTDPAEKKHEKTNVLSESLEQKWLGVWIKKKLGLMMLMFHINKKPMENLSFTLRNH
jgi:hypothetical protein